MSGLVIDSSVAVKWFFPEPQADQARALLRAGMPLVAPDLVIAEASNVAWKKVRMGQATAMQALDLARGLRAMLEEIVPGEVLSARAVEIALALNHPVYDAFYLALAEARDLPLVTADRRLADRAAGTPWASLVRPLV
ncbi:type II toxin-antitoxin system VapC family toxin [Azospirillum sp.]|uniref:type II toxin-antitoxin system VapC family toxin n=1 Tax=Azospirillum sp. TaxID=34012 RepID=UPI002D2AB96C|nr:type II toxin-antitoxin system VapC family toxin [Azospirillum sp.]HYD71414.1 type II toxin-antitoxin system VapC family toxin [Azospirillum sp.]